MFLLIKEYISIRHIISQAEYASDLFANSWILLLREKRPFSRTPPRLIAKHCCKCDICSAPNLNLPRFYAGVRRTINILVICNVTQSNSFGYPAVWLTIVHPLSEIAYFTRHVECPSWIIKIIRNIIRKESEIYLAYLFTCSRLATNVINVITKMKGRHILRGRNRGVELKRPGEVITVLIIRQLNSSVIHADLPRPISPVSYGGRAGHVLAR